MLHAQLFKDFFCGSGASGFEIGVALADAFDRFAVILLLPFERIRQNVIERGGGILSVPLRVVVQLRLAFGCERNHFHAPNVGVLLFCVNCGGGTRGQQGGAAPLCIPRDLTL